MWFQLETRSEVYCGLLDRPDCMGGCRHIWHTLKMQGIGVLLSTVQAFLRELDLEGTKERRGHRLRRRTYRNNKQNDTCHRDVNVRSTTQ